MPSSAHCHISYMLDCICAIQPQPRTVLDLGCGFGKWGVLCREYLDIFRGRLTKDDWKTNITGVEIFSDYLTPLHYYVYDDLITKNLIYVLRKARDWRQYDLIIMGDVLEHFDKQTGIEILGLLKNVGKYSLLGIPIGKGYPQDTVFGNTHEKHLSAWDLAELKKFGKVSVFKEQIKKRPYAVLEIKTEAIIK